MFKMNKDNPDKNEIIEKILPKAKKAVEECKLKLLEVDFVNEFNRYHLRIFIYKTENHAESESKIIPVRHEDCEKVTKNLADDTEYFDSVIPVPYCLEVSSPGTERKFKSSREYIIFKGSRVKIKLKKALDDGSKVLTGILLDYDEEKGPVIKIQETDKTIEINKNNISYTKPEPEYKY